MELIGKIIKILPIQTGSGKNGTWKKQEYIMETTDKIARKVCFSLWGDKINPFALAENDEIEVMFDLESREYNGHWYTEVKAWKCIKKGNKVDHQETPPNLLEEYSIPPDDLPF